MDRLRNLVVGSAAAAFVGSDSPMASDYNWNDISIGNDTVTCETFFRAARPETEQTVNSNNIQIIFEDTVDSENNSNFLNCSVGSRPLTSPILDDDDSGKGTSNCESPITNNLVVEPKPKPQPIQNHAMDRPNVPRVVFAGQLYEHNRKMRMQQIERTEREQRQFHAKKIPNFNSIHAAQCARRLVEEPKFTIPVTPKVIRNHLKNLERVRAKQQEEEAARQPKPFVAKQPDVLTQPPFVPMQNHKPLTQPMPFNLHSEERVHERHQYDEQYKREVERKERELQEKRQIEDESIRRQIRKAITFKAKPNPFA